MHPALWTLIGGLALTLVYVPAGLVVLGVAAYQAWTDDYRHDEE